MKNIEEIKGIGLKTLEILKRIGINNTEDLINYFPYRYEIIKRSDIDKLNQDDKIIVDGIIENIPNVFYFNVKKNKMTFILNTGDKILNIIIFNRAFLKPRLKVGTNIIVIGKFDKKHNNIIASDIRFDQISEIPKIEGVYHSTSGLTGKQIKTFIDNLIKEKITVNDYLPNNLILKYKFLDKLLSIKEIHNPHNEDNLKRAITRLKYEELFLFMLQMNFLKMNKNKKMGIKRNVDYSEIEKFIKKLPFTLTNDQLKSTNDIYKDLNSNIKMNRLLQGDVGSGKTIVSIIAMYINYLSGYMSALMVPTEVLAKQHYENIKNLLKDFEINIVLLTGKMNKKSRYKAINDINEGLCQIIIGTHALITDNLNYHNLGLVITDEQHRFGVNQRNAFKNKGISPDILYMSATPIPRTYALTLYGDMDISNIKTLPNGRQLVNTILKSDKEIKEILEMMLEELKKNHQIYVIVPLIEESDKSELESVLEIYEKMNKAFGKYFVVDKLYGKMKVAEKEDVMRKFYENKTQILVSTTVVEVGVDVANATMIVIYDSYRFGLSTLHQLRGRVGRSNLPATCILISNKETKRLEILTKTNDGFLISEEDFKLRGSGDLFGVKQSGDMVFKIANIKQDYNLLLKAKEDSIEFLNNNFNINQIENENIKRVLEKVSNLD